MSWKHNGGYVCNCQNSCKSNLMIQHVKERMLILEEELKEAYHMKDSSRVLYIETKLSELEELYKKFILILNL